MKEINTSVKILYAEDDVNLSFVTRDNLEEAGFTVTACENGRIALEILDKDKFDLVILDVMMPELDGFSVARNIRERDPDIPILFLTAKSIKEDRIQGLKIGGDDYITKPFSIEELILRINIFLRRSKGVYQQSKAKTQFNFSKTKFNYENLLLEVYGKRIRLTQKEADVLRLFCLHRGRLLKREEILNMIWGDDGYFNGRSLDVFISRLRKYLQADPNITISNVHGVGFQMEIRADGNADKAD